MRARNRAELVWLREICRFPGRRFVRDRYDEGFDVKQQFARLDLSQPPGSGATLADDPEALAAEALKRELADAESWLEAKAKLEGGSLSDRLAKSASSSLAKYAAFEVDLLDIMGRLDRLAG